MLGCLAWASVVGLAAATTTPGVIKLELQDRSVPAASWVDHVQSRVPAQHRRARHLLRGRDLKAFSAEVMTQDFTLYVARIEIGSNKQPFNVMVDTGSAQLWVPSAICSLSCKGKRTYDGGTSSTYNTSNDPFNVTYLSGPVWGFWAQDDVTIGNLTIPDLKFGAVTSARALGQYNRLYFDGVLGLNIDPLDGPPTLMETLVSRKLIPEGVFGLHLAVPDVPGQLTIGGVDKSSFKGELSWMDVSPKNTTHWTLPLQSVWVAGNNSAHNTSRVAILDSGSSYLVGPTGEVQQIMAALDAVPRDRFASVYKLRNCSATPPPINITLGGKEFLLQPLDYMWYSPVDPKDCIVGIMNMLMKPGDGLWILGIPFLSTYYAAFDVSNRRIGLAPLVQTAATVGANGTTIATENADALGPP